MSKSNPTISVVMPVYNSAKYLSSSIESILNQTFSNFELIIIDDSSTDSTSQIIKKYIKLDKRIITVKNKTNLGICNSLNTGLRLAKGKYIARMDGDDWSYPERLAKQVAVMKLHPKVVICGGAIEVCDGNLRVKNQRHYPTSDKKIREKILKLNPFAHPAVMYRKEAVIKTGGYNEKLTIVEDYDLYFRLGNLGKFANLNDTLLKLRLRDNSISSINATKQAAFHLYVRLKGVVEYGYPWHFIDIIYFVVVLIGMIIIPNKYKNRLYNLFR